MNRLEQNEKLREIIVDCADLWDGEESAKYGKRLQNILDELGIKDLPAFYSTENMNKFIKDLDLKRNKK